MKIVKRILLWSAFSIILQMAGLFYINNYFLSYNSDFKIEKVTSDSNKTDAEVTVPDGATDINVSYNGRYISYYDNDELKVINTKTGKETTVEFNSGVKVSYYKWLSDRNRMLIAEKYSSGSESKFELAYYDVDKDTKDKIKDLTWADKKAEVTDIQASPLTNVIYIKLSLSGNRNSIYWMNIMKEMEKVDTRAYVIGNIRLVPHEDKLVYEDLTYNKIYISKENNPVSISGVLKPSLIAVDNNDNVYIGDTANDKISKIYYGTLGKNKISFKEVSLGSEVDKNDIHVSSEGKIYVNDNFKGIVKDITSGKEYTYSGTFVQMYEDGIVSLSEGKIIKTLFN